MTGAYLFHPHGVPPWPVPISAARPPLLAGRSEAGRPRGAAAVIGSLALTASAVAGQKIQRQRYAVARRPWMRRLWRRSPGKADVYRQQPPWAGRWWMK